MQERRAFTRYDLQVASKIMYDGYLSGEQKVLSKDVSSTGAFFLTPDGPPAGTKLSIEITLPLSRIHNTCKDDSCIVCQGTVIRKNPEGIGVKFTTPCEIIPQSTPEPRLWA